MTLIFTNRLAYSAFMVQRLFETYCSGDNPKQLYVMYDIACVLEKHLKVYMIQFKIKSNIISLHREFTHNCWKISILLYHHFTLTAIMLLVRCAAV